MQQINFKKILYFILLIVCFGTFFSLGIWFGVNKIAYCVPQPEGIDFSLFWDAYNKLQENFIDPSKIDNQKIIYGAISGMTRALEDPYTDFFNPDQAKTFKQTLQGSFDGIGVEIGIRKGKLTVIAPLEGTPGQKAGLMAGDIIMKIDGKESVNMSTEEAVSLIRGRKGTSVVLTIYRENWDNTKDFKIIRDTIIIPSMKWSLENGDTAYIKIFQFDQNLESEFKKASQEILNSPAKKIILDLRNNPGGYLEICLEIAGWFIENGKTITIEDFGKNKPQQIFSAEGNAIFANFPIVVLINEGSASASEILAGTLRDNRGVKLIGTKSFGKGSVQEVVDLKGGSFLKVTIAKWLTPAGNLISEIGLEPDIKIEATDKDIENGKDIQLEKALEIIKGLQ